MIKPMAKDKKLTDLLVCVESLLFICPRVF